MDNVILQNYRNIDIKILILGYDFNVIDEISGVVENANFNIDSNSDIRRTANITMLLNSNYTNAGILNNTYFQSGNGYWFDKYIQIKIGVKNMVNGLYKWYKQGIYLINEPTIEYNATTNVVSFQAIDLMSKFTGMRNGYLTGQPYNISIIDGAGVPLPNVTITNVMKDLLEMQGFKKYVLTKPETNNLPHDINIDIGGTTYDILSELRDINPNWEMYFDIDGVFNFQKIPSGQSIQANGDIIYEAHPTPILTDTDWDKLLISYNLNTNFEDVKNYIEVYGKMFDGQNLQSGAVYEIEDGTATVFVDDDLRNTSNAWILIPVNVEGQETLDVPIHTLMLVDKNYFTVVVGGFPSIKYSDNYLVRVFNSGLPVPFVEYMGYLQPSAIAWEHNPNSPFYVGDMTNDVVDVWNSSTQYYPNHIVYYNRTLWECVQTNISQVPNDKLNTYWRKINSMDARYDKLPHFEKMVRYVCVGGEYDNIYKNETALERARFELYNMCRLHDTITINCVPIYDLDVNKIISITLPNEDSPSYWIIKSISTDFSATGVQTIVAMRYYPQYPML